MSLDNDPTIKKVSITSDAAESLSPKSFDSMGGETKTRKVKGKKKQF